MPFIGRAQWMTQDIPLVKGWNAVHLKVNPADTLCSTVFSDSDIEQVAWWNRDRLDDGTGSAVTDFCYWYRDGGTPSTFGRVVGDQRYLIKAKRAFRLSVQGTPVLPSGTIYLGEANLVGVNVPNLAGADAPTYYEYFNPLTEITRSPTYHSVTPANESLLIRNTVPATNASAAVWLQTSGDGIATYTGPFSVTLGAAAETLAWTDDSTKVRTIKVKNVSSVDRVLNVELNSSLPPPTGHGTRAGNVSLLRETIDWTLGYANRVYVPFLNRSTTSFSTNIAAGATIELNLKPDTSRMAASAGDYMSILVVSDKGSTLDDEVRPQGTCLYRIGAFAKGSLMADTVASAAGLWVGTVVLGEVNRARTLSGVDPDAWDHETPVAAPHPFQFRFIVHVDGSRNAKILKEVFTAKKSVGSATYLLTDRDTAIAFRGLYPEGTITRTSSANFPFIAPLALEGGTFMGGTLTASFTQRYDDKTNPFVHSFHPQHDNIQFNNKRPSKLGSGDAGTGEYESWGVTREITLTFDAEDSAGAASPESWNRTITGGIYEEKIYGLIGPEKPIVARGVFRLSKVNDVASLTTEVIP